jgi:hypothetical protein
MPKFYDIYAVDRDKDHMAAPLSLHRAPWSLEGPVSIQSSSRRVPLGWPPGTVLLPIRRVAACRCASGRCPTRWEQ